MKHVFSILFLLTLSVSIQAQQYLIEGIYYEINPYNRTAMVVCSSF